jgi:hypothetical protein
MAESESRKPFAAFLQEQRGGGLHGELSDAISQVVAAALEHGKKGQLVLTIDVKPNADGATVLITDKIKATVPEANRGAAIWFVDGAGNLSRRNPAQPELPFREIDGGKAETA